MDSEIRGGKLLDRPPIGQTKGNDESEPEVEQEKFKRPWLRNDVEAESEEFCIWLIGFIARGDSLQAYMKVEEQNQRLQVSSL